MAGTSRFDFEAAVSAPFRMQPGLRPLAPGTPQLTPAQPGSRHQREKLAVLSSFWPKALLQMHGFDAGPALQALAAQAAAEHPRTLQWDGRQARSLGVRVDGGEGRIDAEAAGSFGLGDEVQRCLVALPPHWRLAALLCLAFEEDFAVVDATSTRIPWLAVCLPSMWAPEEKVGLEFAAVHAPVADAQRVTAPAAALTQLVSREPRHERFVWSVTPHSRLHAHPEHIDPQRWASLPAGADPDDVARAAWWRTERQTFIPLPGHAQAVFTIHVEVTPLVGAIAVGAQARLLHAALASMSPAVQGYRSLTPVHSRLLAWLAQRGGESV